jgi:CMP/dCMP kinase
MIRENRKIIVAIDGYSSCGKSSFAKMIASELKYIHIDSGAMYRAVALYARNGEDVVHSLDRIQISFRNMDGMNQIYLNGVNVEKDIRTVEIGADASTISKIAEVRRFLVSQQQRMGKEKGIVMDGRDIGTIVFPKAEIKIFMTASMEVRAKRRYDELITKGMPADYESVRKDIRFRDEQDTTREVSPLRKAEDAVVLDNSNLSFDDQMNWFRKLMAEKGF